MNVSSQVRVWVIKWLPHRCPQFVSKVGGNCTACCVLSKRCFVVEYSLPVHFRRMDTLLELWRASKPFLKV
jgi:hypothetical protein